MATVDEVVRSLCSGSDGIHVVITYDLLLEGLEGGFYARLTFYGEPLGTNIGFGRTVEDAIRELQLQVETEAT